MYWQSSPLSEPWEGGEVFTDLVGSLGKAKPDGDAVYKFLSEKRVTQRDQKGLF